MRYQLTLIKYPSGRYGWVGTVPAILCDSTKDYASLVYNTVEEAEKDARSKGIADYAKCV